MSFKTQRTPKNKMSQKDENKEQSFYQANANKREA